MNPGSTARYYTGITSEAVPTNEFINVSVDGVANVKISSDPELLKLAAEAAG